MRLVFPIAALMFAASVAAVTEYRSIAAHGNVIYSDRPAENAVRTTPVAVAPGPSAEALREAEDRAAEMGRASGAFADEGAFGAQRFRTSAVSRVNTETDPASSPDPRGPLDPADRSGTDERHAAADTERRKEVLDAEPRREVRDAEPRREVRDAEPRREVLDAEPRREVP
jgi:hypothetical protein